MSELLEVDSWEVMSCNVGAETPTQACWESSVLNHRPIFPVPLKLPILY